MIVVRGAHPQLFMTLLASPMLESGCGMLKAALRTKIRSRQMRSDRQRKVHNASMLRLLGHHHGPEALDMLAVMTSGVRGCPVDTIFDWDVHAARNILSAEVSPVLERNERSSSAALTARTRRMHREKRAQEGGVSTFSTKAPRVGLDASALKAMPNFDLHFKCEPNQPHRGFKSWDDFFTREFRPGVRPVALPGDDAVIVNACESAPYRIAHHVKAHDRFWIKSQPYSILHMLANDRLAPLFVGGTVYQAYLSPLSYHRWHSPVSGTVIKVYVKDGTYYSEAPSEGFDPAGPNDSQGYITAVATRAPIFIEADNADVGLMCVLAVGMAEVSTCQLTVYEGQHVMKGDQIGMFHFGGSTHCLIFRPGVTLEFDHHGQTPGLYSKNIPVNSRIATVRKGAP